ncbi:SOS response-associated peptidase [Vibrio mexicanus]|uniref:SOS response-associated peptidase n=1 Tax=Vibrio mexicanus TaxID=1004326 RepID=UPI00063C6CFB|nr:SOS response-associated peptidase family protein [Vibrio mexicanus]
MCGRLNIIDDPLSHMINNLLGIEFSTQTNPDLRPSETVEVIAGQHGELLTQPLKWGIQPEWAKRIIINAQSETVATKPTFSAAFGYNRVIVPCSGWYEWQGAKGSKRKYLFANPDDSPVWMAGIALELGEKLVTLTTQPNLQCSEYHHRMPLLLNDQDLMDWLFGDSGAAKKLLMNRWQAELRIEECA